METKTRRQGTKRAAKDELELTKGEMLYLWRRRLCFNQSTAAKKYKCSVFTYKKAEYDQPIKDFFYDVMIPYPSDNEKCIIYRRRSGLLQKEIAKKIGVSRYWINRQEKGKENCTKLLAWWIALYK